MEIANADKRAYARGIWDETQAAAGTTVESYLLSRGLTLPIPPSLRFHPRLKHPSKTSWPAMVALVTHAVTGERVAIHRTFLAADGQGKAPVKPDKMMLGPTRGGVVRLGEAADSLLIGEGIETCLSVQQATRQVAWAALSTSGLRSLILPDGIRDVTLLADGDQPGEAAALEAAHRWRRSGRSVRIVRPPQGRDFNDLILKVLTTEGGLR